MASPPTVVADRFELLAEAARGAMGSVHRARDRTTGALVAVKIVVLEEAIDLGRFQREAALLATVRHPNIVEYIAHGEATAGVHFLAQEWVDGPSLRATLRRGGVTAADGVIIARGIAEALSAVHAHGVVHRDVKPDNVIVADGDPTRVKLVDFGIARRTDAAARLTRTGVMIGTPAYMAPEQARGEGVIGPPADVWALGCMLYECLAGRTPFAGSTPMTIRTKVLLDQPPDLALMCPEAPDELIALVERMLSKNATLRPPSGTEAAAALVALPAIGPGPRREVGSTGLATKAMPLRPTKRGGSRPEPAGVLVFFTSTNETGVAPDADEVGRVAVRHGLAVHQIDDESIVLASGGGSDRASAAAAAHAAVELSGGIPGAVLSVVARGDGELADAIDRGTAAVELAAIGSLFGDLQPTGDVPDVRIDEVIAALLAEDPELDVHQTDHGAVVRAHAAGHHR